MRSVRVAVVAGAIGLALVPLPRSFVERWYANGFYPLTQPLITGLSNAVPIALFDVLLIAALVWYVWRFAADLTARSSRWPGLVLRAIGRLLTAGAALYLAFLVCWGLNYRRVPLRERLAFDADRAAGSRARDVALAAVDQVNNLYDAAHAADAAFRPAALVEAFVAAERDLGVRRATVPAWPKRTLLDRYFRLAGIDGMTDPYFLETLVASNLLPFERPFVIAHEWGHLAGFADESEASFVGWLVCLRGAREAQYSGWLFLYSEIAAGLGRADLRDVSARLDSGPRGDLRAVAARIHAQVSPVVSTGSWRLYDRYLKANRVEAGMRSYDEFVRLVLGETFDPGWKPRLK